MKMDLGALSLLVFVTLIWGSNFSVIGVSLNGVDPFMLTALRFTFCALPLVFFIKKPAQVSYRLVALYGLLFGAGMCGLLNFAIFMGVSPGVASLVLQFSAFFTVVWGVIFFQEKMTALHVTGILLSVMGLILIVSFTQSNIATVGILLVLLSALCWSFCNVLVKREKLTDMFSFVIWSSLFAVPPLYVMTYLLKGSAPFESLSSDLTLPVVVSIMFQAYIATVFGYWVWNKQMNTYLASQVAPWSIIVPISGMLTSWWAFDEVICAQKIFAMLLTILGVGVFINAKRMSDYMAANATFYKK